MKSKLTVVLTVFFALSLAGAVFAQDPVADRTYDLPKFTVPPVLDGDRFSVADEWTGTQNQECSISEVLREGALYGWRDIELQRGEYSANQLNQSEGEDAAIALTDADVSGDVWHGWDNEALYFFFEVRDNVRDVTNADDHPEWWWERDSVCLYLDLLNEDTGGDITGVYTNLNIINYTAAPMMSSSRTITLTRTVQEARTFEQEEEIIAGLEYGFTDRGDEFGGEADYAVEGKVPWETMIRGGNLPAVPPLGAEMGYSWIILDPDGDDAFGGQLLCAGWASEAANYSTWIFSDIPAGPAEGTAVEEDSWGRIKATFK